MSKIKTDERSCPICGKTLSPNHIDGKIKYFCDCAGYIRPVIEILTQEQEGVKEYGSAN